MPSVTVDLADLETLVMTTGALKVIEGAIVQRKQDPFVRGHLEFTAAHDRLASAMRNARRAEAGTLVPWDVELDEKELRLVRELANEPCGYIACDATTKVDYDSLAAKGCVSIGQNVQGTLWAGESKPELRHNVSVPFMVRITDRGREKLAKIDAAKTKAADLCGND